MTLLESKKIADGTKAPDFNLTGVDLEKYSLDDFSSAKVLVVVFMCNHCPYVQAVWKRLVELQMEFIGRGVQLVGINSNFNPQYPEETLPNMKKHYEWYGMNFPYLLDETQNVAKAYGAECTPDIFAYDEHRGLFYHGRIDDNWKEPDKVTKRELKEAIDCLLMGEKYCEEVKPSMGCSIKWA
ncbi:thioredoxin family protein [Candidatus Peregrinibacteria bacterium]|nr:thioredoxin family protein [Candidatus Peregrinibacteria bacterium]